MTVPHLQKSTSTLTLAERRRIPTSPEKLKVYAHMAAHTRTLSNDSSDSNNDRFRRLEAENAKLPPQDSEEYLLARLERQNALLNADPKSVCIESNRLKADFSTLRTLVSDNTFSPTRIEDTEALLNRSSIKHTLESTDYDVSDWDFWQCVVDDFPVAAAKLPHLLAAKLRYGGIPHRLRGVVWQAMARSSATNLESMYDSLVLEETQSPSPYERVIKRDLSRTFPHIEMFKADGGEGQQAMGRLLKAYSVYDAHVGYCQGLAFLVGPLLMTLLSQRCPRLDAHLTQHSIHPAMYASQWYLTLFAYSLPLPLVLRIYDLALAEGAVETITRVAIALMVKNEEHLLDIDDFEELMIYLSSRKLYEEAYDVNIDTVIADTMSLSALISKAKMDSIAETHDRELAQEKDRAHQVLAVRFGGWGANNSGRRESWFNWGNDSAAGPTPIPTPTTPTISQVTSSFPCSPVMQRHLSSPNIPVSAVAAAATEKPQDRTVPLLHQQIEDLVVALSQLQKEHSVLSEDLMTVKMREMDQEAEHAQVLKLNDTLNQNQMMSPVDTPTSVFDPVYQARIEEVARLQELEQDGQFRSFVESLRLTGDFGALIAGALSESEIKQRSHTEEEDSMMRNVTAELVSFKLANFEMGQKYEHLCHTYEECKQKLQVAQDGQRSMVEKVMDLQNEVEAHQIDKEELYAERDELIKENEELAELTAVAKKTSTELQVEKLSLAKDVEALERRVKELEEEKREYLMPRGSFTEEVFAAHRTLFKTQDDSAAGNSGSSSNSSSLANQPSRRHTLQMGWNNDHNTNNNGQNGEYQKMYIESELRCRELEKLLAEAKFKIVEHETSTVGPISPRASFQQRRASSVQIKRNSAASLSMLAYRGSSPTSPPSSDSMTSTHSTASHSSSPNSNNNSKKRSSVYSRLWTAFGTSANGSPASSVGLKSPIEESSGCLYEEPERA
ncbi:hypothetical protein J3Q64DRAFT_1670695 [Phycomyces blakesleeanus]|uniref:Rab-GAP TBC domain-containing protein n=1 Tax=Phycomyces blakesleeanus TaxID=4837 RepID=A0ABR3BFY3_PHYBL